MVFFIIYTVFAPALPPPILPSLLFSNTKQDIEKKAHFTARNEFCTESASKPQIRIHLLDIQCSAHPGLRGTV